MQLTTTVDEVETGESRSEHTSSDPPFERGRSTGWWIASAVVLSVLLRVRMLSAPLSADEGGYLAIARAWAHGRVLYRDVWVDRPQGLIGLFRVWDWLTGGGTASIRVLAMLFGAVLVVSAAIVAGRLYGARASRWTAVTCAVLSSAPMLEGYIPNGELLSAAVATTGLAVAVVGFSRSHEWRWMFAAGLLAGAAISVKQSGFDALIAISLWLAMVVVTDPGRRRRAVHALLWLGAGCGAALALLLAHAALTGWDRWWTAVGGYRSTTSSLFSHPSWSTLRRTGRYAGLVLGPALLAGVVGLASRAAAPRHRARQLSGRDLLAVAWLGAATFAFLLGGGYWRHYWLLLAAPISVLAGAAIADAGRRGGLLVALVVAPALVASTWVFAGNTRYLTARAASDFRAVVDHDVATWFETNRRTGDTMYMLCGEPAVYADIDEDPPLPYLWFPEAATGPHALQRLIAYLTATPPTYIAEYTSVGTCDPSGGLKTLLDQRYHPTATVDHVTILMRSATEPRTT